MRRKYFFIFVTVLVCMIMSFSLVSAYTLEPYKQEDGWVDFKWGDRVITTGTVARNAFETARSNWNYYQSNCIFVNDQDDSTNTFNTYVGSATAEYGHCNISYSSSTGYIIRFDALINISAPYISDQNFTTWIACHELGHVLGLGEGNVVQSVMYNTTYNNLTKPQQDDLDGVNYIY